MLFPKDGRRLGLAWTKQGRNYGGLAVKTFAGSRDEGRGAPARAGGRDDLAGGRDDREAVSRDEWASVFTTAVPIPAAMWRGLARFAGCHVYSDSNDVLMADRYIVALHSIRSGPKLIDLPSRSNVFDVVTGKQVAAGARAIRFYVVAPETRVFRLEAAE